MTQTVNPVSDKQNPGSWTEDGAGTNLYEALDDHPDTTPTDSCISPSSGNNQYFEVYIGQLSDPTSGNITINWYSQRISGGATVTCQLYGANSGALGTADSVGPGTSPTLSSFTVDSTTVNSGDWDNATGLWLRFTQTANNKQVAVSSAQVTAPDAPSSDDLTANDIASLSSVSAPTLGNALSANDIASLTDTSDPSIAQTHILDASNAASLTDTSDPSINQTHALSANDVSSLTDTSAPTLAEVDVLSASDIAAQGAVSSPTLTSAGASVSLYPDPSSIMLREPCLLMRRKKPLGAVTIDLESSFAVGLKKATIFNRRIDLAEREILQLYDAASYDVFQRGDYVGVYQHAIYGTPAKGGGNTRTCLVGFKAGFPTAYGGQSYLYLIDGAYTDDGCRIAYSVSSQDYYIQIEKNGTAKTVFNNQNTSYEGQYKTVAARDDDAYVQIVIDGVGGPSTASNSGNAFLDSTVNFNIGRNDNQITTTWLGDIYFVYYWHRALTDEEIKSVHNDPYQFLVPA